MKISLNQSLALAAASCLALSGAAFAKSGAAGSHGSGNSPGNSSFGTSQRSEVRTGPGNSAFGRDRAENVISRTDADDQDDQNVDRNNVKTKKIKKAKLANPGNSAFGRSQRINHLRGSGNNIHGKTTSAKAKAKHTTRTDD
jgi:hypothetical protein